MWVQFNVYQVKLTYFWGVETLCSWLKKHCISIFSFILSHTKQRYSKDLVVKKVLKTSTKVFDKNMSHGFNKIIEGLTY